MRGSELPATESSGPESVAGRRWLPLVILLPAMLLAIAALQLITAPSLVAALIAPDLGKHVDEPLRGTAIAQSYFIPSIAAIVLALVVYMLHRPVADVRIRLLLINFVVAGMVILAVLILGNTGIISEESKLAHFTGAALLLAALCAGANALLARKTAPFLLWGAISAAFAFAALDEILEIHERLGIVLRTYLKSRAKSAEPSGGLAIQDSVTLLYSIGGLLAIVALYFVFRKQDRQRLFFIFTFLAAAVIYFISTVLDSFDFLLAPLSSTIDLLFLASVLEELLEFLAATLFLVAFATAILESGERRRLEFVQNYVRPLLALPRPALIAARFVAYALLVAFIAACVALPLRYSPGKPLVTSSAQYSVRMVAHSADNTLLHPDGMAFANGHLYVANDVPPSVMTIVRGKSRLLATADELGRPETIAVAPDGTVYVTDDRSALLLRIRQGLAPQTIVGPEHLTEPKGLAFDPAGVLYIADVGASAILVLRGNRVERFAAVPGHRPEEIAFDRLGNLYFTEERPARVMKISRAGVLSTFIDGSSGIAAVEDIAISGDDIYLADSMRGAIFRFAPDGRGRVVIAFEKRTGTQIEGITLGERGGVYIGFRKPEGSFSGMRRIDFIMCAADRTRINQAC